MLSMGPTPRYLIPLLRYFKIFQENRGYVFLMLNVDKALALSEKEQSNGCLV